MGVAWELRRSRTGSEEFFSIFASLLSIMLLVIDMDATMDGREVNQVSLEPLETFYQGLVWISCDSASILTPRIDISCAAMPVPTWEH